MLKNKVVENKEELIEETELISDRIEFLEHCLKISTESEILIKLGLDNNYESYENIMDYVKLLQAAYEKLRWIPLKLNTLLHFEDFEAKQLIAEEAKNNVIMSMNETLQNLSEWCDDISTSELFESLGVELIEAIRTKIVY